MIHWLVAAALLGTGGGCPEEGEAPESTAERPVVAKPAPGPAPVLKTDAGTDTGDTDTLAAADTCAPDEPVGLAPGRVVTVLGEAIVYRAIGRARRGVDIDLGRQAAADHARRNLASLLKKKGLLSGDEIRLADSVIERYWRRGRWIYAQAAISLPKNTPSVNVPVRDASNSSGTGTKTGPAPAADGGKQ